MRWVRVVAVAGGLLAALTTPAAATPDPVDGFGINIQSLVRSEGRFSPDLVSGFLGVASRDGLRVGRTDGMWSAAEPTAPGAGGHVYDWTAADATALALAQQGMRWDVVLDGCPRWAGGNTGGWGSPTPDHYGDFAAYAAAFVARYGPGGSFWAAHPELTPQPVTTVEILNEPNTQVHWGRTPDPAAYASLYYQAREAIKAVDPAMKVLIGGIVWNDDAAYLQGVLDALGPGAKIDGVGSHPYAPTVFSILPNVVRMRGVLDRAGHPDVPLALNELGWPAAYDRPPAPYALQGPVTDASRAATMALTVDTLARSTCDISGIAIFDLVEGEDNPAFVESLMGIYRRDGSSTQTSAALAGAIARYRALGGNLGPLVPACGPRGQKTTQLLGLRLSATPRADGCTVATVTYRGLPLEEAQVRVLAPYRGVKPSAADGTAVLCPPRPGGGRGLRLVADVPGAAQSNLVVCDARGCRPIGAAAACVTTNTKLIGTRRPSIVARRGLALRVRGCSPQQGGPVRLTVRVVATKATARTLRHALRVIGRGTLRLAPGAQKTLRVKVSPAVRRALRAARRAAAQIELTAVEAGTKDTATKMVVMR